VYSRCPDDFSALKQEIRDEIVNISEETLREMRSFSTRVHLCIQQGGDHLKDITHTHTKRNNVKEFKHKSKL